MEETQQRCGQFWRTIQPSKRWQWGWTDLVRGFGGGTAPKLQNYWWIWCQVENVSGSTGQHRWKAPPGQQPHPATTHQEASLRFTILVWHPVRQDAWSIVYRGTFLRANPHQYINDFLAVANNQRHRAQLLFDTQLNHGEFGQMNEIITIAQEIIEKGESWTHLDMDRMTFMEWIDYEGTIRPGIEEHRRTDIRRASYEKKIVDKWGENWRSGVDATDMVLARSGKMQRSVVVERTPQEGLWTTTGNDTGRSALANRCCLPATRGRTWRPPVYQR